MHGAGVLSSTAPNYGTPYSRFVRFWTHPYWAFRRGTDKWVYRYRDTDGGYYHTRIDENDPLGEKLDASPKRDSRESAARLGIFHAPGPGRALREDVLGQGAVHVTPVRQASDEERPAEPVSRHARDSRGPQDEARREPGRQGSRDRETRPQEQSIFQLGAKMSERLEAKYGLPHEVKFCRKCIISNQRPNSAIEFTQTREAKKKTINFDENGVCDACPTVERKHKVVDWAEREKQLIELCNKHRSTDGSYDYIVPGSGGKDSFFAAHMLKYKYGMNPLTVTWAPHIYTDWGWKNFQAWIHAGFDNMLSTPNGRVHRLLTRLAIENLLYPFQPFALGQKALAPKLSALHKVPLVFYGEHEAEYGNPTKEADGSRQSAAYFTAQEQRDKLLLGGVAVRELKSGYGLTDNDIEPYLPANPDALEKAGTEVHYLGYYLKWHPQGCYYYAVETRFQPAPERSPGTYSKYNSIDDKLDDFYFYTYFVKFGLGRASYDSSQEIRSGEITREEGVALVKRFDGEFPERFAAEIFRYLSLNKREFPKAFDRFKRPEMTRESFDELCDSFRSPHLWEKTSAGWRLRHAVWHPGHL